MKAGRKVWTLLNRNNKIKKKKQYGQKGAVFPFLQKVTTQTVTVLEGFCKIFFEHSNKVFFTVQPFVYITKYFALSTLNYTQR